MMHPRSQTAEEIVKSLLHRGVCGTCGSCPMGMDGEPLPHLCENVNRYDHKINVDDGLKIIKMKISEAKIRRELNV